MQDKRASFQAAAFSDTSCFEFWERAATAALASENVLKVDVPEPRNEDIAHARAARAALIADYLLMERANRLVSEEI